MKKKRHILHLMVVAIIDSECILNEERVKGPVKFLLASIT
jgi:hypothetical protein